MGYRWRNLTAKMLPWWLQTGEGGLVKFCWDTMLGAFSQRAIEGLYLRGPTTCTPDALSYHGSDRKIVRGINEPDAAFGARLIRWLDDHRTRGNPYALHAQLRAYMQADVMVRTVDFAGNWFTTAADGTRSVSIGTGNWIWDAPVTYGPTDQQPWAQFWVIIYPLSGKPWSASVAGAWPSGGTIGTSATPDQVASVRGIINDWQPDGTTCREIVIAFDPNSFDPTAPDPDGHWTHFGKDVAGHYQIARLTTARYWIGALGR